MLQRFFPPRRWRVTRAADRPHATPHTPSVKGRVRTAFPLVLLLCAFAPSAVGDVIVTLEPSDPADLTSSARVSFSGSGIIAADGVGSAADFLNFDPAVFDGVTASSVDFPIDVEITGNDVSASIPYFQQFGTLRLTNQAGGDDLIWRDRTDTAFVFELGDSYEVFGTSVLTGLAYSDLVPGDYQASMTSGDAARFGGATLQIRSAAVPEPSSIVSFAGLLGCFALWQRRRRAT